MAKWVLPDIRGVVDEEIAASLKAYTSRAIRAKLRDDERTVRHLLEGWVSGLDPAIAMDMEGNVIGLCDADAPLGVKPFIFRG